MSKKYSKSSKIKNISSNVGSLDKLAGNQVESQNRADEYDDNLPINYEEDFCAMCKKGHKDGMLLTAEINELCRWDDKSNDDDDDDVDDDVDHDDLIDSSTLRSNLHSQYDRNSAIKTKVLKKYLDPDHIWFSKYSIALGKRRVFVHYYCALFSPQTIFDGLEWQNVRREVIRSASLMCYGCQTRGATLVCADKRCPSIYHIPCALKIGSTTGFLKRCMKFLCPTHHTAKQNQEMKLDLIAAQDVTKGRECIPISVVNTLDDAIPMMTTFCQPSVSIALIKSDTTSSCSNSDNNSNITNTTSNSGSNSGSNSNNNNKNSCSNNSSSRNNNNNNNNNSNNRSNNNSNSNNNIFNFTYITTNLDSDDVVATSQNVEKIQCCDCEGLCNDVEKCACLKQQRNYTNQGIIIHSKSKIPIFECNMRCRCSSRRCANRVVEQGIKYQFQVFRGQISIFSSSSSSSSSSPCTITTTAGSSSSSSSSSIVSGKSISPSSSSSRYEHKKQKLDANKIMYWGLRTLQSIPQGCLICEVKGQYVTGASLLNVQRVAATITIERQESSNHGFMSSSSPSSVVNQQPQQEQQQQQQQRDMNESKTVSQEFIAQLMSRELPSQSPLELLSLSVFPLSYWEHSQLTLDMLYLDVRQYNLDKNSHNNGSNLNNNSSNSNNHSNSNNKNHNNSNNNNSSSNNNNHSNSNLNNHHNNKNPNGNNHDLNNINGNTVNMDTSIHQAEQKYIQNDDDDDDEDVKYAMIEQYLDNHIFLDTRCYGNISRFIRQAFLTSSSSFSSPSSSSSSLNTKKSITHNNTNNTTTTTTTTTTSATSNNSINPSNVCLLNRRIVLNDRNDTRYPKLAIFAAVDIPADTELVL